MRRISAFVLATAVAVAVPTVSAQPIPPDWQRASNFYLQGWNELGQDPVAAEGLFKKSVEAFPEFALGYYGLGRAYMQQKRFTEALTAYQRSESLFQAAGSDRVNAQLGLVLRRNYRDSEVAQQAGFNAADTRMTPSGPSRRIDPMQAELANQMNVLQQAAQKDARSTVTGAVPPFLSLAMGSAYFRLNQLEDAERQYSRTVDADPKNGEAWNNLAVVYLLTERLDDAERAVKSAEKAGFRVNPNLKSDIKKKKKAGGR